jgi:hypothetical protein
MSGLVKRVWLLLYTEGGRWTAAEIRHRLHLQTAVSIHATLRDMVETGFLSRSRTTNIDGETPVQYGVTRGCKVPRGVTVDEMWDVLQMGKK